jgi:mono/diheme cytochrome c family protein
MLIPAALLILAPANEGDLEARVREVFDRECTMCHGLDDELNLEAVTIGAVAEMRTAAGGAMIEPGSPDSSYLYLKMLGTEGIEGDIMPPGGDALPQEQLDVVAEWIRAAGTQGAGASTPAVDPPEEPTAEPEPEPEPKPKPESAPEPAAEPEPEPQLRTQSPTPNRRAPKPFFGSHQINLQTTTTLGKKTIAYRLHHRFGRVGSFRDRSYLGLASGVVMSMGVEYGIIDGLDVLVRWSSSYLDWELGAKYVPLRQEDGAPLSLGAFASFEGITDFPENAANRATGNFQIMISRLWWERWSTQLTVGYSMFTNHDTNVTFEFEQRDGVWRALDKRGTLNLGAASTVWLGKRKRNGIDLEYILPIPDGQIPNAFYYHGGDADPEGSKIGSWSLGWSGRRGGHLFQVFVSNTRNIHTNLVAPGGDTKNPFKPFGDFFFGFNLGRRWKL